ncbi:MAG TPA: hypothetical protein VFE79_23640 [Paraburkholderia sp.]|jgi:hypothetical protein|nr:hypothetical protein [Paraburkholderia sp.]
MASNVTPPAQRAMPNAPPRSMLWAWTGLLLAPFAWLAQMVIAETLASQSCFPFDHPLSAPLVSWLRPALVGVSALCLAAGAGGTVIAWRAVRRTARRMEQGADDATRRRARIERFLARVAAMCSALFLFALIATDVALVIVLPCRGW